MMVKIVLLGAPGAGKGTVSEILIRQNKLKHISVGDILRDNITNGTELGKMADNYMKKGLLVPNEIVIKIVQDRLSKDDCKDGFLLDGYPRTIEQAIALDNFVKPDFVFNIEVQKTIIIDRLIGRRMCNDCSSIYHISSLKEEKCPKCNVGLTQRKDDKIDVVKQRIEVYETKTKPLIDYYTNSNRLININGSQEPIEVYKQINEYLK